MGTERRRLREPVSVAPLVRLRVTFGALMAVAVARYFAHGWIDAQFVAPRFFFPYAGFGWVRPWPAPWMHLHFAALGVLALAIAAGWRHRLACALFCVGFTWVHAIDRTNYLNHYYLVSLVAALLACLPLDRRRTRDTVPRWQLDLVRFQVGAVYFFAGVAKLQPDWLLRAQPLRIWFAAADVPAPLAALLALPATSFAASWAAAAFDLSIPFLLAWRRTRRVAFVALVAFHAITGWLFPIGLFPWLMVAMASVFLGEDRAQEESRDAVSACGDRVAPSRAVVALAALWVALQLALPLRAFAMPGDVLWNEAGMRFSWRVMIAEKQGATSFRVRDPATGRERVVHPSDELTPAQVRMMATQPDMLLSYAHHLAEGARVAGVARPEVYADGRVSLNGRPGRPLVDPTIDLAALPEGTPPWRYVVPLNASD